MNDVEVLEQARALIAKEQHWCQGKNHMEILVKEGPFWRRREVTRDQYCAWGAVQRVVGRETISHLRVTHLLAFGVGDKHNPHRSVTYYNDNHRHDEVLEMFDHAIAKAKALETQMPKLVVATHVTERDLAASGD